MRSTTAAALLRCSALAVLFALCGAAPAQSQKPVTVGEANAVLHKVDSAIRKTLGLPAPKATNDATSQPVTRAQVLARLDAMFEAYRPKFAYTPRPFRSETGEVAKANKDAKTAMTINKLVKWGCVGPVAPLAVGPSDTLTTEQFGDAIGYFMSQIAALTYYADPAWTPVIQPPQ